MMTELRLHPSYSSVHQLLDWVSQDGSKQMLFQIDDHLRERYSQLQTRLESLRKVRRPASTGTQAYDSACLSILDWIVVGSSGHNLTT